MAEPHEVRSVAAAIPSRYGAIEGSFSTCESAPLRGFAHLACRVVLHAADDKTCEAEFLVVDTREP